MASDWGLCATELVAMAARDTPYKMSVLWIAAMPKCCLGCGIEYGWNENTQSQYTCNTTIVTVADPSS